MSSRSAAVAPAIQLCASDWCEAQRANIQPAFAASDMTIKVDVVDWARISESFRKIVSSNAVVVQQAKATD